MITITLKCLIQNKSTITNFSEIQNRSCQLTVSSAVNSLTSNTIIHCLEKNGIIKSSMIDYIRYYNISLGGWMLLKQDTEIIFRGKTPTIKLYIKPEEGTRESNTIYQAKKSLYQLLQRVKAEADSAFIISSSKSNFTYGCNTKSCLNDTKTHGFDNISEELNSDIVILSANPLVDKASNGDIIDLQMIYDDNNENKNEISQVISQSQLNVKVNYCVGSLENLTYYILEKNVKILHILCNSWYNKDGEFYLCFENNDCELVKLTYSKLDKILNDCFPINPDQSQNQSDYHNRSQIIENIKLNTLIIINTPCSIEAFELFKKLSFANIIAIHSNSTNTNLTKRFLNLFYDNIINKNKNFKEAYYNAMNIVITQIEKNEIQNCCCFHPHNKTCKWFKTFITDNNNNTTLNCGAHFIHIRNKCNCNLDKYNLHLSSCQWGKKHIYKISSTNLCCCINKNDSKIEHSVSSALMCQFCNCDTDMFNFKLNYNINNTNLSSFQKTYTNIDIDNNNMPQVYRSVGYNLEMYQIYISLFKENKNVICIYGKEESEVENFAKILNYYLYERITVYDVKYVEYSSMSYNETFVFENEVVYIVDMSKQSSIEIYSFINEYLVDLCQNNENEVNVFKVVLICSEKVHCDIFKNNLICLEQQNENEIKLQNIKEKCKYNMKEYEEFINRKIQNKNLIYQQNSGQSSRKHSLNESSRGVNKNENQTNNNNTHNYMKEIEVIFIYSPFGLLSMEIYEIFNKEAYNPVEIISYIKSNLSHYIIEKKDETIEQNIFEQNEAFKSYLNKKKPSLPDEIKQNMLKLLFDHYRKSWLLLLKKIYNNNKSSFSELTSAQNYGLWISLYNSNNINQINDECYEIDNPIDCHRHLLKNFDFVFTMENIDLLYQRDDIWKEIKLYICELSICLPTFMDIILSFSKSGTISLIKKGSHDLTKMVVLFGDLFKKYTDEFKHENIRLTILKCLFQNIESNEDMKYNEKIKEIDSIYRTCIEDNFILGAVDALFASGIVQFIIYHNINKTEEIFQEAIKLIDYNNETNHNNANENYINQLNITKERIQKTLNEYMQETKPIKKQNR